MSFRLTTELLTDVAMTSLGVGLITTDADGHVTFVNPVAEDITGWPRAEAEGKALERVFSLAAEGEDEGTGSTQQQEKARDEDRRQIEEGMLMRPGGHLVPVEYAITSMRTDDGPVVGLLIVFSDRRDKRLMALQLERLANRDPLTGLLNRQAFLAHMGEMVRTARSSDQVLVVMDVDQFKLINSSSGHEAGDDLLQWVAALLREAVGPRDVLARLGGDEFAVLLASGGINGAIAFAKRLRQRLREFCFSRGGKNFTMSVSLGLAPLSSAFTSPSQALSAADQACYMAKEHGRGGVKLYEPEDAEVAQQIDDMNWVTRISSELNSGRTRLYGQPIAPLSEYAETGLQFEVLLRLGGEGGEMQTPGNLIRAAERYGLMPSVDRWVIRTTLETLSRLPESKLREINRCFINLSGLSLHDDTVLDFIRTHLADSRVPPHKLGFEITETAAVGSFEQARWLIQELGSIGCRLALDDFGTGHASYGYLRDLPVQYVKIDGSFVEAMATSDLDRCMVESINQISHVLGIQTVGESVGNSDALERIRAAGIDYGQGFFIARPKPIEEVIGHGAPGSY